MNQTHGIVAPDTDTIWMARAAALQPEIRDFFGGRSHATNGERQIQKLSPRDGTLLYGFGCGTAARVNEIVAQARAVFEDGRWSRQSAQARKHVLLRLADLVERNRDELALLECLDVGKPISDAINVDIPMAAAILRFNAEACDKLHGIVYGADASSLAYQLRRPIGVVAAIVGWNFPLVLAAGKIGPALATGNSLVLKPSETTSLATARLAELAAEAGVPDGVFSVVHGDAGVGGLLASHSDIDLLTFTGSTATGRKLLVAAGQSNMKRLVLECGGKAPNIVFEDDPDLDAVAENIVARAFWNNGQVCTASSRLVVQDGVKDRLVGLIVDKLATLKIGDPLLPQTSFGALASGGHRQKVLDHVAAGTREGAVLVFRSELVPPFEHGFYAPMVVLDRVEPHHSVAQEEIFGPVLSVLTFQTEEQALAISNATIFGLSATVWTRDLGRAHRMVQGLNMGLTVVNGTRAPTGGPAAGVVSVGGHKQSGIGIEGGLEGLADYLSKTAVQIHV